MFYLVALVSIRKKTNTTKSYQWQKSNKRRSQAPQHLRQRETIKETEQEKLTFEDLSELSMIFSANKVILIQPVFFTELFYSIKRDTTLSQKNNARKIGQKTEELTD